MEINLIEGYLIAASMLCGFFLLLTAANCIAFRRLNIAPIKFRSPKISILIPARDEESNIRACLDSLLAQDYANYEILVLDDNSTDATASILREYESAHSNIKTFTGKPLPAGWLGKHYACHQLSQQADGEYFLFTDADTVHGPKSVSWALTNMLHHEADFMSAFPRQKVGSIGEAIVVPGMYLLTSFFLPVWLIPRTSNPFLSFAIGQFVFTRASAFWSVGGYEKIKDCLVDDISLVRNMKRAGFRTLFLDGKDFVDCRMYHNYKEAFAGFTKSLYAALDKKPLRLLGTFALIVLAVVLPFVNLVFQVATGSDQILLSALPVLIFLPMWCLSLLDRDLPLYTPFLYPLQFVNLLAISLVSAAQTGYGKGALWKGRWVK